MIRATTKNEKHRICIEIEGTGKEIFSEMCALFSEIRGQHKELYLMALRYAREVNEKENKEDA